MTLFYHDEQKKPTYDEVYTACRKGYGVKQPDRILGFNGFFYSLDDIYLYGKLEGIVENNSKLSDELKGFIDRFLKEDYGFVTENEYDNNSENRWLCGSCSHSIGRYMFKESLYGGIVLEFLNDRGFFYCIGEDMTEVYARYNGGQGSFSELVFQRPW